MRAQRRTSSVFFSNLNCRTIVLTTVVALLFLAVFAFHASRPTETTRVLVNQWFHIQTAEHSTTTPCPTSSPTPKPTPRPTTPPSNYSYCPVVDVPIPEKPSNQNVYVYKRPTAETVKFFCSNDKIIPFSILTHWRNPGHPHLFCRTAHVNNLLNVPLQYFGTTDNHRGDVYKVFLTNDLLQKACEKSSPCQADPVVMFVDGYDVVFQKSLDDVYKLFMSLPEEIREHRIIFSTENNCWPDDKRYCDLTYHRRPKQAKVKNAYINAGAFIGRLSIACKVYERATDWIMKYSIFNDQEIFHRLYATARSCGFIDLDWDSMFFQSFETPDIIWPRLNQTSKGWLNTISGLYPAAIHFNGGPAKDPETSFRIIDGIEQSVLAGKNVTSLQDNEVLRGDSETIPLRTMCSSHFK